MSLNGLNIAVSGLFASQVGLDVTSNNIANANTEGYSRKTLNFLEGFSSESSSSHRIRLLNGVVVDQIRRMRNTFLDQQVRQQNSLVGYNGVVSDFMIQMNDVLGEPSDSGLAAKLNQFFQAASDLATNPELDTAKTVFINSASVLSDAFNQIDNSIQLVQDNINQNITGQIPSAVSDLNTKLTELADVHARAQTLKNRDQEAAELLDRRDLLLDQISEIMDINIVRQGDGSLKRLTVDANASEALVESSIGFSNHDSSIAALTAGNNSLDLTINNGNGSVTGPMTVNFEAGSTIRDVVKKINNTFKANGGKGSIASVDESGKLVLQTTLVEDAKNNATASITIGAGSTALTALGLTAGSTTGSAAQTYNILDNSGLHYKFNIEKGINEVGSNPGKLILEVNDATNTKVGNIDDFTGSLGGLYDVTNKEIPDMRKDLDDFAMSIKDAVNNILTLGKTTSGNAGSALFTGTNAGNLDIDANVLSNNSLIAQGKTGAVSDGSIAAEIADLFFGDQNIISDGARAEKLFIDSPSTSNVTSQVPLIAGEQITIHADGLIDDDGSLVNAGTNGFGGGSLVQIEFVDASGTVVGSAIDFPSSAGAPEDRVSYVGTVPAGAAFVRFKMNGATFNDNDLTNNLGHFGIQIKQGLEDDSASNLNNRMSDIVGSFGTKGSVAISKADNASSLYQSLDDRRQSIMGVSIEEEAANLIRFQNSFSANARVVSVMDAVLQEIVNMI